MLGRASVAITLTIYSYVLPSLGRDTAAAMDDIFSSPHDVSKDVPVRRTGV